MKNKIFFHKTIIGFLSLLFFTTLLNAQDVFIIHEFSLSEHPGINHEVKVSCSFEPLLNEKLIIAKIILPDEAKFINGDSIWTGSATKNQLINFAADIIFTDTGNLKLQFSIKKNYDSTKWAGPSKYYYLHVGTQNGSKGWKKYYNEIERQLIKEDSAGFFERKIFYPEDDTTKGDKNKSTINVNGFLKYFPNNSTESIPAKLVLINLYKNIINSDNYLGSDYTDDAGEWEIEIPPHPQVFDLLV